MSRDGQPSSERAGGADVDEGAIAHAFAAMYQPVEEGDVPDPLLWSAIVDQFHRLYYHASTRTWRNTRYRGVSVLKCPLDLWVYQEMIHELRPELVIETGTAHGGSGFFLADTCDAIGTGRVVTIDIEALPDRPRHGRLTYLTGSSTDPAMVARVTEALPTSGPVLVILDSDHSFEHVVAELEIYAAFVTPGSYVVVEDTNVGGHPVLPAFGRGPAEAVEHFLKAHREFEPDRSREKFMLTFAPSGYLRRISVGEHG